MFRNWLRVAFAALLTSGTGAGVLALTPAVARADTTVTTTIANGMLTVTGTNGPDTIEVAPAISAPNQVLMFVGGVIQQQFDRANFTTMRIVLRGGDDHFDQVGSGLTDLPVTIDAGAGNDTIIGGAGPDTILGGAGNDFIRGGAGDDTIDAGGGTDFADGDLGHDVVKLGGGPDTFQWDPGDGSDTIEGGSGVDTVAFNGANIGEVTHLLPNGSRVLFRRNIGNVELDMGGIERLTARLLGGEDFFTADDMRGTPMRDVRVDLSSTLGSGDAAVDTVAVNGTNRADRVNVTATNGQVDVTGLRAAVHIVGAEQQDQLDIFTIGGNDTVNVAPEVASVMFTFVDLGLDE
jgi:Ca2+-binding RTX toxin-like protein